MDSPFLPKFPLTNTHPVCPVNVDDGVCGIELLPTLDKIAQELKLIRADKAYKGEFVTAAGWCGYFVEITQKPPSDQEFIPQKGLWQVYSISFRFYHFGKITKLNVKTYPK